MLLVDTSVWIDAFRGHLRLRDYVQPEDLATCAVIVQEVLQGVTSETLLREVRRILAAAAMLENPLYLDVYEAAAEIYRTGRKAGFTIRRPNDCLIAVVALKHDIPVLHADRDFDMIARFTSLQAQNVYA